MTAMAAAPEPSSTAPDAPRRASNALFVAGLLSRTWLWFVGGCLVVTLAPLLFGWRPFVVESGSMMPRIDVGDVVLAAPVADAQLLVGRVAVFDDPSMPDRTKTHRVVSIDDTGAITTKGDANPSVDSATVTLDDVRGMGRLLVQFVGLPLIWVHTHQWGWLILLTLSLLLAGVVAARDHDDESEDSEDPGDPDGTAALVQVPTRLGHRGATEQAASRPVDPGLRRWAYRAGYATVLAGALTVPTVNAALAASSSSTANTWTVRAGGTYASVVTGLGPWMWWRLDDTGTGSTATDTSGNSRPGQFLIDGTSAYVTKGATGALPGNSPNTAVTLTSTSSCIVADSSVPSTSAPGQFTAVVWFKTSSTAGGKLIGFENLRTGVAAYAGGSRYDRHVYLDANGRIWFGMINSGTSAFTAISSTDNFNNDAWHMVAAVGSSSGMSLYVDGVLVSSNSMSSALSYSGFWRSGCGNLSGWNSFWGGGSGPTNSLNQGRNSPYAGSLDEVSVWTSPLTATQVSSLYNAR